MIFRFISSPFSPFLPTCAIPYCAIRSVHVAIILPPSCIRLSSSVSSPLFSQIWHIHPIVRFLGPTMIKFEDLTLFPLLSWDQTNIEYEESSLLDKKVGSRWMGWISDYDRYLIACCRKINDQEMTERLESNYFQPLHL